MQSQTQHNVHKQGMDWFSWLSKTSLDPSVIYGYGLVFIRNELQEEDLAYFNHELLQSMGISVAKHRIEILKLAKEEKIGGGSPRTHTLSSKLLLAIKKTKRCVTKGISKWVIHHNDTDGVALPELRPYRAQWSGALSNNKKQTRLMELNNERLMVPSRSPVVSGPLDRRVVEEMAMLTNGRSPKVSSPLDGRVQKRCVLNNRSPEISSQLNGRLSSSKDNGVYHEEKPDGGDDGLDLIWAALFQDMKPT